MADTMETINTFLSVVESRRSMRDFKSDSVPQSVIEAVFGAAQRAPSNCNTQPWFVHVVTGETLEKLRSELPAKFAAGEVALDFPYDGQYEGVYKERQYASAASDVYKRQGQTRAGCCSYWAHAGQPRKRLQSHFEARGPT